MCDAPYPIDRRPKCTPFMITCLRSDLLFLDCDVLFNGLHANVILLLIPEIRWGLLFAEVVLAKHPTKLK